MKTVIPANRGYFAKGSLGVEYKGGFKFTKKKDGYLLEEDDR